MKDLTGRYEKEFIALGNFHSDPEIFIEI